MRDREKERARRIVDKVNREFDIRNDPAGPWGEYDAALVDAITDALTPTPVRPPAAPQDQARECFAQIERLANGFHNHSPAYGHAFADQVRTEARAGIRALAHFPPTEATQVAVEAVAREIAKYLSASIYISLVPSRIADIAAIISKHCTADAGEVERLRFVSRLLALAARYDIYDSLFWHSDLGYFGVNVNDVFAWGCADLEEVTPENIDQLEQAITDCQTALPDSWEGYGPWLFAARNRKTRPQGASYPTEQELWSLFDACGPERETGFGNPYKPGAYKPTTEAQRLAKARADTIRECATLVRDAASGYNRWFNNPQTYAAEIAEDIAKRMESLTKKEGHDGPHETLAPINR